MMQWSRVGKKWGQRKTLGCAVALTLFAFMSSSLSAQTTQKLADQPEAIALEPTVVKGVANAAVMDYDQAYVRLQRFHESKLDRIKLEIRALSSSPRVAQSALRVAIVSDDRTVPIKIAEDGLLTIPLIPELYKKDAVLLTNAPKGSITVTTNLGIAFSGTQLSYDEVEEILRQLRHGGKDLLGWFGYMLFFPAIENMEIPIRYPAPRGQTLSIVKDGRTLKTFTADNQGVLTFRLDRQWESIRPTLVFSEAVLP